MSGSLDEEGLPAGVAVGEWQVVSLAGEEGNTLLLEARHRERGERGVVKILRMAHLREGDAAARFAREARALRAIEHRHVVPLLDAGRMADGRPFLVRAPSEGLTLSELLSKRGPMPPEEAWALARPLVDALAVLHALGVVHRNLEPRHVRVEEGEGGTRARLFGFGFVKSEAHLRTDPYAAPELSQGGGVDGRADLYGFGATLTEMLVGAPPSDQVATMPSGPVRGFLQRLLSPDVADRFANAWAARAAGDDAFAAQGDRSVAAAAARGGAPSAPADASLEEDLLEIEPEPPSEAGPPSEPLVPPPPAKPLRPVAPPPSPPAPPPPPLAEPAPSALALAPLSAAAPEEPQLLGVPPPGAPGAGPAEVPPSERRQAGPPVVHTEVHLPRYLRRHGAMTALGLGALLALGFAGPSPHDAIGWVRMGGASVVVIGVAFAAAAALLPVVGAARATRGETGHRGFALAAAPVLLATLATGAAWTTLRDSLAALSAPVGFTQLLAGAPRVLAPRFVGFGLGAVALLLVATMPTRRFREQRYPPWRVADLATAVLGAGALAGIVTGASSGAFVAAVGAAACHLGRGLSFVPTATRVREAADHAIASVTAVLLAVGAAFARLDARMAAPFAEEGGTRTARMEAIVAAAVERSTSRALAALAVLVVIGVATGRFIRLRKRTDRLDLPRSSALLLLGIPAFFALDLAIGAALPARRAELLERLTPELQLLSSLDPPVARAVVPGRRRSAGTPMLQVTREAVAIEGQPLGRLDALSTPAAREAVVEAIARVLADNPRAAVQPDLALVADRRVDAVQVRELLRLARQGGARRIEVLLARAPRPLVEAPLPLEGAAIVDADFTPVLVTIGVAGGGSWQGPYGDVAAGWEQAVEAGDVVEVGVGW